MSKAAPSALAIKKGMVSLDSFSQAAEVVERLQGLSGEIQLQRRGSEFEIIYNGVFLMATYNGASEKQAVRDALLSFTCNGYSKLRALMGGLGVGYSLHEALSFKEVEQVKVVEIEPAVIGWNRKYFGKINGNALNDKKCVVVEGDFYTVLTGEAAAAQRGEKNRYHLIMVDTDNGSGWLSIPSNAAIYKEQGLKYISTCLHPNGIACFWVSRREEELEESLGKVFKSFQFHSVLEKTGQEGCYYLARKD